MEIHGRSLDTDEEVLVQFSVEINVFISTRYNIIGDIGISSQVRENNHQINIAYIPLRLVNDFL